MKIADINQKCTPEILISEEELEKAAERLKAADIPFGPRMFFTGGTIVPDQTAIEYWKDTSIIVVTRDGTKYQYGKKMEE